MSIRLATLLLSVTLAASAFAAPAPHPSTSVPASATATTPAKLTIAGLPIYGSWLDTGSALHLQNVDCKPMRMPLAVSPNQICQFKFKQAPTIAGQTAELSGTVLLKDMDILFAGVSVTFKGADAQKASAAWLERVATEQKLTIHPSKSLMLMTSAKAPTGAAAASTPSVLAMPLNKKNQVELYWGASEIAQLFAKAVP